LERRLPEVVEEMDLRPALERSERARGSALSQINSSPEVIVRPPLTSRSPPEHGCCAPHEVANNANPSSPMCANRCAMAFVDGRHESFRHAIAMEMVRSFRRSRARTLRRTVRSESAKSA
ncbi:MAG: hypothetical protein ACXWUG_27560, partial [Polyangiales bacterium]